MPKFLIERQVPGIGSLPEHEVEDIARRSVAVLRRMGSSIQWVQSYVCQDALYCVYIAPDEEAIREHARLGAFPVTRVTELVGLIDPTTAEGPRKRAPVAAARG